MFFSGKICALLKGNDAEFTIKSKFRTIIMLSRYFFIECKT